MKKLCKRIIHKIKNMFTRNVSSAYRKYSWSQVGEDIIAEWYLFTILRLPSVKYIDIGANHPYNINNTYKFYKNGIGVLVEPNPALASLLRSKRPKDIVLECGCGVEQGELLYYMMDADTLNSFSKEECDMYCKKGHKLLGTKPIPIIPINDILDKYGTPDFLSIDIEGVDFDVLKAIDYTSHPIKMISVETIEYMSIDKRQEYNLIVKFLESKGYMIFADTFINTLFVNREEAEKCMKL